MSEAGQTPLHREIGACRHCVELLPHEPRPVVHFSETSRLVIVGQAPGSKVHSSGIPWDDESGDRLREWTGLSRACFYDPARVALVPMGFCYPGKGKGGDLPPRKECAPLWHERVLAALPSDTVFLLVGSHAQKYYLPRPAPRSMTEAVRGFTDHGPRLFPLPHPAWRARLWMQANPWFESDVLPQLRAVVAEAVS